jgi:ankyrin repeat protein
MSVSPAVRVEGYHVPTPRHQAKTLLLLSGTTRNVEVDNSVDTRPHEQRTEGPRKARRLNHPFQHLYRHDDPAHYPTYENSTLLEGMTAREFLIDLGGWSDGEIGAMAQSFPPLLDLDVMRHLRPKLRFLKYTLGGVAEVDGDRESKTQFRLLSKLGKSVPPPFFGARLEKTVAPRHAFLQHVRLPHGSRLLEDDGALCQEFLVASRRTKQFCALCNAWRREYGVYLDDPRDESSNSVSVSDIVRPEQVEAFDTLFSRGLMSAARNDIEALDSIEQHAIKANVTSSEMVKLLVCAGANPLEKDVRGVSLVHWAAGAGNLDGLVELIDFLPGGIEEALGLKADRDGASPLHWASAGAKSKEFGCGGHVEVVRFFLENCVSQGSAKTLVNMLTKDGNSVLMWAAWSGSLDVCKILVRNRADTSVSNRNGCTVAHWAASGGNFEVCKYLYDVMQVDFTAPNYAGNTPLSHAVAYGRADVVEWLRNDVCTDDEDGRAEDLALDFVNWTEGDSDRMKVYDLFNNDDWGL